MAPSPKFFPNDLVGEILSALPVKSILRFRCVSKYCDNLVSDPNFVKLHLKRSSTRNPQFILKAEDSTLIYESPYGSGDEWEVEEAFIPCSLCTLIENPSFAVEVDPYYVVKNYEYRLIGSCNGLICFGGQSNDFEWFRLWNPATRKTSAQFGFLHSVPNPHPSPFFPNDGYYQFNFGCDDSTGTYKIVASRYNKRELRSNVKILSFRDSVWRDIETFPVDPLNLDHAYHFQTSYVSVYFKSTINWLAIQNHLLYPRDNIMDISVEQFVIVSLDLRTETYNQYLLPPDFDEVPPTVPNVSVLGNYLCFAYSYKDLDFVIWKMEKFGVEYSWTQFFKINYHNLQIDPVYSDGNIKQCYRLKLLFLSEDGDTLILESSQEYLEIIYTWRDNRKEGRNIVASRTTNDDPTIYNARCTDEGYFESLVSVL